MPIKNETLRKMKESGAIDGTGKMPEEVSDPSGFFDSMFKPGPYKGGHASKEINLELIDPWHDAEHTSQPFKPYSKEKLEDLAENIRQNGVISPITLRTSPFEPNRYQVLVGHNRVEASKLAGKKTIPANIIQASDEEAKLILVDSNLYQRDHLLHSEKAFAYKMRLDTIKQQGKRVDLTSTQVAGKLESADQLGHQSGESGDTIRRYIRLTHLLPPLLDMVDQEDVPFTAGVSISFLSPDAQTLLLHIMAEYGIKKVTRSQSQELKDFASDLDEEKILRIFGKSKKSPAPKLQNIKFQVDYPAKVLKKLVNDMVLQQRVRDVIDTYVRETMK